MYAFCFSHLPPNQGGKYSGFGYTMDPPPRSTSQEFFDTAVSSLSSVSKLPFFDWFYDLELVFLVLQYFLQGWSLFSSNASKIASKATENAFKIGNIATQKVSEIGATVGEKVSPIQRSNGCYFLH